MDIPVLPSTGLVSREFFTAAAHVVLPGASFLEDRRMGIRYYAYAFDRENTEQAIADPYSILSDDPLADAWGLEPHVAVSYTTFEQSVPKRDMLYLDKAWSYLQEITAPGDSEPRVAFAMFEGQVSRDLDLITDEDAEAQLRRGRVSWRNLDEDVPYALAYLREARDFMRKLVEDGRGMVYTIG